VTPGSESSAAMAPASRMSLGELLRAAAERTPDRVGFVVGDASRPMAALDTRVDRLGHALASRGVGRGDRVAVLMTNRIEMLETLFAVTRLGAIAVPMNFRLVAQELEFLIRDSGAQVILTDDDMAPLTGELRRTVSALTVCLVAGRAVDAAGPGAEAYEDALAAANSQPVDVDVPVDAPAFILYTSGTTGLPKGAVLTHENFVASGTAVAAALDVEDADEVWLSALPLFHIGGIDHIVPYVLLSAGRSVIQPSSHFSAEEALDLLEAAQVTVCFFVPTQWQAICDVAGMDDRQLKLKRIAFGAAPTLAPLIERLARRFPNVDYVNAFGQTETCGTTTLYVEKDALHKMGSVGKPIANIEIRVVDDAMRDVTPGEVGEVVYRGPSVFAGYWQRPQETDEAFAGGWFHSGDLCRVDEDGYFFVVDRKKDMIISGGENIYSAEVEAVLEAHPKVHEAAVIGVPHNDWGETPHAVIVATRADDPPAEQEIIEWCRDRMASYKKPTSVRVVDELPHNASGKVLKHLLKSGVWPTR
jgi:fatty-acyl-CoA synthase